MHEVLVNRLGGLSLPRKSVGRLTDRPDMTLDVYRGRKTTMQQQRQRMADLLETSRPGRSTHTLRSYDPSRWMDDWRFYVLFNSILVISGRWADDNERLYALAILPE